MDAIFVGCLTQLQSQLPGAAFVEGAAGFKRAFHAHRVVVVDPALDPADFDTGFAAVLALSADGEVGEWTVEELLDPASEDAVNIARVRLWIEHKAARARLVHDLRAPIGVLLGNCQLLKEGLCGPVTPRQTKALDAMERAVTRLTEQIDRAR
jgi:signal transduction histidine kinase